MKKTVVMMVDGGAVRKYLEKCLQRWPTANDIEFLCYYVFEKIIDESKDLLRIYFYDAPPFEGERFNPLTKQKVSFSMTPLALHNKALLRQLELKQNFAVRRGELSFQGWKLGKQAYRGLTGKGPPSLVPNWLVPDFEQKGVDMKIGLDIAWISVKRIADIIVLVAVDSDFIPAMKLARKEGLRIYLDCLDSPLVKQELKIHADVVL